jgi:hypothetical protein
MAEKQSQERAEMCLISIGHQLYLMPATSAFDVMRAMTSAEAVEKDYDSAVNGYRYKAKASAHTPDIMLQACSAKILAQIALSRDNET